MAERGPLAAGVDACPPGASLGWGVVGPGGAPAPQVIAGSGSARPSPVHEQRLEAGDGAAAGGAAGAGRAVLLDARVAVEEVEAGQDHAVTLDLRWQRGASRGADGGGSAGERLAPAACSITQHRRCPRSGGGGRAALTAQHSLHCRAPWNSRHLSSSWRCVCRRPSRSCGADERGGGPGPASVGAAARLASKSHGSVATCEACPHSLSTHLYRAEQLPLLVLQLPSELVDARHLRVPLP